METYAPTEKTRTTYVQSDQTRWLAFILLAFAIVFNLYHLYPEIAVDAPPLNDNVLHWLAIQGTTTTLATGDNPTDFWLPTVGLGYPLFHHYQHLGHLLPALLHHLTGNVFSLPATFNWAGYLLLSLFPLSIYWSMRRFGFDLLPAAMAGLTAPLLSSVGLFGLEYGSYVWRGSGLYTQLWGMVLLPLALAQGYAVLRTGRGFLGAVLLLSATILAHTVFGYMGMLSLVLLALVNPPAASKRPLNRLGRLALLLILTALVASYFLLPFWLDRAFMNRSIWEDPSKYDSYGYEWILGALFKGELFDHGRFPSFTLLAVLGLVICLRKWRQARYRIPVALTALWLLLYFGRPTWGVLLNLLPLSGDLHFHRLIAGVHLGGIYLIGLGLGTPWQWLLTRQPAPEGKGKSLPRTVSLPIVATITGLLLFPAYVERGAYLAQNARWRSESRNALITESLALGSLLDALEGYPPGRVYAGQGNNWGNEYKVGMVPMYSLLSVAGLDMLGYNYHALSFNSEITVLFDDTRPEQYDLFNVRYVVAPTSQSFPDFVKPIGDFGQHRLYQVESTGYFGLVETSLGFSGDEEDFYEAASTWLYGPLPAQNQHPALFLDSPPEDPTLTILPLTEAARVLPTLSSPLESFGGRGRVLDEQFIKDGVFHAQVQVLTDSTLMLKTTYHPGWRFWIDDQEIEPFMIMPSYLGVPIRAGPHQVRAEYSPGPLRNRLLVLGLFILALIALAEWRWKLLMGSPVAQKLSKLSQRAGTLAQRTLTWKPLTGIWEHLRPHLPYLCALSLLALLTGLPSLQFKIMDGHDALVYLPRTVEFYENLKHGNLIPRWAPDLNAGYGQPSFIFNPPLFYYLSTVFHLVGFSFVASQNLAILAIIFTSGLGMYLLATEAYGSRGGLVAAVAYIFAPYFIVTLYVRHALADFSAFAWIPFAFWGLYRYAINNGRVFAIIGATSLALLILSSNPVALISFPFMLLMLGWVSFHKRDWAVLLRGFLCLALGLGLSAYFWLPAIAERNLVHLDRVKQGYLDFRNHFVFPFQLIHSPWGHGLSLPGSEDGMSFAIGPLHLLLIITALLLFRRIRVRSLQGGLWVSYALILSFTAAFLATQPSSFIWDRFQILQFLEFPWRFLSLVAVGTAFLFGYPFLLLSRDQKRWSTGLAIILIAALLFYGLPKAKPASFLAVTDADYTPQSITMKNISVTTAREYEPVWVQERPESPVTEPLTLLSGNGRLLSTRISPTHIETQAIIIEPARLRANIFYFPGWSLYVDGAERPIDISAPQGLIEFSLEPGNHIVQIVFIDTLVRLWSKRFSLLALTMLFLLVAFKPGARLVHLRRSSRSKSHTISPPDQSASHISLDTQKPEKLAEPSISDNSTRGKPANQLKILAGLYLLLLSTYLLSANGHFLSTDHVAVYRTTKSLVEEHDLSIEPLNTEVMGPDGQWYAVYGLVTPILSIPFYKAGIVAERLSSPALQAYWSGANLGDWGGTVPIFFVSLLNQFVIPLVCLLVYLFERQMGFSARRSATVALILGLGTLAWSQARDYFQHPLESLWLLLAIYILFANRNRLALRHALVSGIALGLGALTRVTLLPIIPLIGMYLWFLVWRNHANDVPQPDSEQNIGAKTLQAVHWSLLPNVRSYWLAFSIPVLLAFIVLLCFNQARFGNPLAFHPSATEFGLAKPLWIGLYINLLSPGRSIILYNLPILLSIFAFKRFYQDHRAEALLILAISAVYLSIYSFYGAPEGGWSWGPRFLWAIIPLLILALGYYLNSRRNIVIAILLASLGAGVQFLGVAVNWSYVYWDWLRMGYDSAVNPDYLYIPQISPIPMHFQALLAGRYIEFWLYWVHQQYGLAVLLYSLALPLSLMGIALVWLSPLYASALAWLKKQLSTNSDTLSPY